MEPVYQVLYRANRASPVFEEVAGILRKTSGMADELMRILAPLADKIRVAFVFGSMAQGSQGEGSDIDLLVRCSSWVAKMNLQSSVGSEA